MKPRIGQELEVINEALDIGEEIFIPERPAEQSLPKLSSRDLLPPSSTAPIPLEYEHGDGDHEFVQERRIEFLVMKKSRTNKTIPAGFLDEKELQQLFDHVRNAIDDIQIMDTVLWTRVDKATTISSMMLCTLNYRLFNEVRHAIRIYQEIDGYRIETYEKAEFVKKIRPYDVCPERQCEPESNHADSHSHVQIQRAVYEGHRPPIEIDLQDGPSRQASGSPFTDWRSHLPI